MLRTPRLNATCSPRSPLPPATVAVSVIFIGVGFIFTDDLTQLAREYPHTKFAGVDYSVATDKDGKVIPPPSNLAALRFREEQGSYLVGALAALPLLFLLVCFLAAAGSGRTV